MDTLFALSPPPGTQLQLPPDAKASPMWLAGAPTAAAPVRDGLAPAGSGEEERRVGLLAERLAIHLSQEVWQRLFYGTGRCSIGFTETPLAVLCVEAPEMGDARDGRDDFRATLDRLAARHGGLVDAFAWGASLVFFAQAEGAVRTAVALQRAAPDAPLRMGIHSGPGLVARFRVSGAGHATLLGPQAARAQALAAAAAYGSVSLSLPAHAEWSAGRGTAARVEGVYVMAGDAKSATLAPQAGQTPRHVADGAWRCEADGNGSMRLVPTRGLGDAQ